MKCPVPRTVPGWFKEIELAVADARAAGPFGESIGQPVTDANLFHLAPLICLKFRGRKLLGRRGESSHGNGAANYVVNSDPDGVDHGLESKPLLAFAVCYVTAHLALDLIDEKRAEAILNYCEKHLEEESMKLCEIWKDQCDAARQIEAEFGTQNALDYLIGEKFLNFLQAAETDAEFRAEIPAFVAEIKTIFEPWKLADHLETARQSEPFDPDDYEDEDPEMVELDRQCEISRSASDLLLVERAREWLLQNVEP